MTNKQLIARLQAEQKRIAADRDRLRAIFEEFEEYNRLAECCDRAVDDIERAVDALSELV